MRKEKVTRHKAEEWLGATLHNRRFSSHFVSMFADDMKKGDWDSDVCPPILIDKDTGGVLNGQHRLRAFLSTDLEFFDSYVHYAPRDAISVIDTGRVRTLTDTLEIRGHNFARAKSAWLNRGSQWITGYTRQTLTRAEQVAVIESAPNLEKAAEIAKKLSTTPRSKVVRVPSGTIAVLWDILEYSIGGDFLVDFVERLQMSQDMSDQMRRLQIKMLESANTRSKFGLSPDSLSYLIARVLTSDINEENLSKMFARRAAIKDIPGYKEWVDATYGSRFDF